MASPNQPLPPFYTAWTMQVNAIQLGARLTTIKDTRPQINMMNELNNSLTSRLFKFPPELLSPIIKEVQDADLSTQIKTWAQGIKCCAGECDMDEHLTLQELKDKQQSEFDLVTAQSNQIRTGVPDTAMLSICPPLIQEFGKRKGTRHWASIKAHLERVKALENGEEMAAFMAQYGVKPLFMFRLKELFVACNDKAIPPFYTFGDDGHENFITEAYIALPAPVSSIPTNAYYAQGGELWEETTSQPLPNGQGTTEPLRIYRRMFLAETMTIPYVKTCEFDDLMAFKTAHKRLGIVGIVKGGLWSKGWLEEATTNEEVAPKMQVIGSLTEKGWASLGQFERTVKWMKQSGDRVLKFGYRGEYEDEDMVVREEDMVYLCGYT